MPTGPRKIILINAGKYDYAEVDLDGTLQIVGPNNTGKTTLINTLQFLYINDQREMDFGSYTKEQTRDFYFRSQYSYVLFECLSSRGQCVMGWRGQSRASGGDAERFLYFGPYAQEDFFDEAGQVREPRDVNARLALRQYETIKTQQQHRELLLNPVGGNETGLSIISLRDPDKYPHFRETLKNLLSLSTISQEQMKDRLLMLADISPGSLALDARELFGEDYDRIRGRRDSLVRFKQQADAIGRLVARHRELQRARGEAISRWADLRAQREQFDSRHQAIVESLRQSMQDAEEKSRIAREELVDCRANEAQLNQEKGGLRSKLTEIRDQGREFKDFVEELERAAAGQLEREVHVLHQTILDGQAESREKAEQKVKVFEDQVRQREATLRNFDHLLVTALRRRFKDAELDRLFSVLSFDLLELPTGADGVEVRDEAALSRWLEDLLSRTSPERYSDARVGVRFGPGRRTVAALENPETIQAQLSEYQDNLERWRKILHSIHEREKLQARLSDLRTRLDEARRRLVRWEEYQKTKAGEPLLQARLERVQEGLDKVTARVTALETQLKACHDKASRDRASITSEENQFNAVMGRFNLCHFPDTSEPAVETPDIPRDFDAAVSLYLKLQDREETLAREVGDLLRALEGHLGDEFLGATESETITNLAAELEALPEKEDALGRDWNAHIHELKGAFDHVLKELGEIQTATDQLNRQFSKIQVSNLKALKIEAREQSDLVSRIRRLAEIEQPSLFDSGTQLESTLKTFRERLQANPLIRFGDLFTLQFSVVGDDDVTRHYQEFRQIESHGTTITIKVLFNLLILKSLLRKDDCVVPFFLDEIQALDPANRHAILTTARKLGFVAITAAPESVTEVDSLYFLQPHKGRVVLRHKHRLALRPAAAAT